MPKRTNKPGISSTNRFPRAMRRGRGGGGAARMAALAAAAVLGGYRPARRPRSVITVLVLFVMYGGITYV